MLSSAQLRSHSQRSLNDQTGLFLAHTIRGGPGRYAVQDMPLEPLKTTLFSLGGPLSQDVGHPACLSPSPMSLKELEQPFHGATFLLRDKNSSKESGREKERELIRLNCTCNVARAVLFPAEGEASQFLPSFLPFTSQVPSGMKPFLK